MKEIEKSYEAYLKIYNVRCSCLRSIIIRHAYSYFNRMLKEDGKKLANVCRRAPRYRNVPLHSCANITQSHRLQCERRVPKSLKPEAKTDERRHSFFQVCVFSTAGAAAA